MIRSLHPLQTRATTFASHTFIGVAIVTNNMEDHQQQKVTEEEVTEEVAREVGFLPWEEDLEMMSKYHDRKVRDS